MRRALAGLEQLIQQRTDAIERDGTLARARPALDERGTSSAQRPRGIFLLIGRELEQEGQQLAIFVAQQVIDMIKHEIGLLHHLDQWTLEHILVDLQQYTIIHTWTVEERLFILDLLEPCRI